MTLAFVSMNLLWHNALGAIPLAIGVAVICRVVRCRASTRHALWLIVLLSLMAPPLLPGLNLSDDLGSPRFFSSLRQQREVAPQPGPTISATIAQPYSPLGVGASAPTEALTPNPALPAANSPAGTPVLKTDDRGSTLNQPLPSLVVAMVDQPQPLASSSLPSCLPVVQSSTSCVDAAPSAWAPASSSSSGRSTASDRSPTALRMSASHPDSSAALASTHAPTDAGAAPDPAAPATVPPSPALSMPPRRDPLDAVIAQIGLWIDSIEWRNWLLRVAAARNAIVGLAPIPTSLWLGGCAILLAVMLVRIARFRRVLRNSWPASNDVHDVVGDCAAALGLRHLPAVLVTDARVSPLVWCGLRRRTLVVPLGLWDELDDTARRAVLLHELAHVMRRDHWVCWIEMIACTVYWWNPVAWWVRARLRDEADYCCDAWVTAVLPSGVARTAYARALLTTKQYLNASRHHAPSLALGATSARTKRFARRLTMVMTERTAPRLSLMGSAVALLLAAGTWLATPLWACPPEESSGGPSAQAAIVAQKAEQAAKAAVDKAKKVAKAAQEKAAKTATVVVPHEVVGQHPHVDTVVVAPGASTFERHMAGRDHDAPAAGVIAQAAPGQQPRVRAMVSGGGGDHGLEARIDRLEQRMDRLTSQLERLLGGGGVDGQPTPPPPAAAPRTRMAQPAAPAPPSPPAAPRAPAGGVSRGQGGGMAAIAPAPADQGEQIVRFYPLPADKAVALFEFMRRDDVPVLVAAREDGIEVHGTARQHEIFAAFIRMINPDSASRMDSAAPANDRVREELAAAESMRRGDLAKAREQLARARQAQGEQMRQRMDQQRRQMEEKRQEMLKQREHMRKGTEEMMKKSRELNRSAAELQRKADALEDGEEKAALEAKVAALEAQAEELEAQADAQQDELDARLEAMEDELEAHQEALEAELEAQQEAIEAEMEARMAALEAEAEALETTSEQNPR
jgi:beta-lactamase regulating signal transducer with metallopeptidase domain